MITNDNILNIFSAAATISVVVVGALFFAMYTLMGERSRSRYDDEKMRAELSAMRASYEAQLAKLTAQMTATEERWRDVNHLLVSAQKAQPEAIGRGQVALTPFMREMGVTDDYLTPDPNLIFVLTPFSDAEESTYLHIRDLCQSNGFRCVRGDEDKAEGPILAHIIKLMVKARIVIANITSRNANVYYELGVAHSMGKPTILVSQTMEGIPFDIATRRIVLFSDEKELEKQLTANLLRALRS